MRDSQIVASCMKNVAPCNTPVRAASTTLYQVFFLLHGRAVACNNPFKLKTEII